MFEKGKTYRVKTLEQLLATPGALLRDDGSVVDFSTDSTVYALCNDMTNYLGKDIKPSVILYDGLKAKCGNYIFIPEMILLESKKLRLLNAIKDFK